MASDSLKSVIKKLKKEGIEAAEKKADKIIQDAQAKAEDIQIQAEMKAKTMVDEAKEEAETIKNQLNTELNRSAQVALDAFKTSVEEALVIPAVDESLEKELNQTKFLEKVILEVVKGFVKSGYKNSDIQLVLSPEMKKKLGSSITARIKMLIAGGKTTVDFDDDIRFGFKAGPKEKGFVFDLTDKGFREILVKFISPKFRELFYTEATKEEKKENSGEGKDS
ncbi:MAG: hypothetical protein PF689_14010 [Deltaproteobacteria bacterium]|jgi:V/A-type H+-transporting ATPase subunit E|nr:hypothetical protein [Deltaproteobacteria bacterium]